MNKLDRQQRIKRIVKSQLVGTQEEIKDQLALQGLQVTQATLSRDLREIGLLKLRDEEGRLYYSLAESSVTDFSSQVRDYVTQVARAEFMLVLHTKLGEAGVLANIIDQMDNEDILGTVAGVDTVMVICKDEAIASHYETDLYLAILN